VYPGHGAGSACGKALSSETWSTIGDQKSTNYALQAADRDTFVQVVTDGQSAPPAYFGYDGQRNREARDLLDESHLSTPLSLDRVLAEVEGGAVVLDTREPDDFARGHLTGAVNVGLSGRYAEFVGGILAPSDRVVLVADPEREDEAVIRLARIGYDRVVGHLDGGVAAALDRPDSLSTSSRLTVSGLEERRTDLADLVLLDVRQPGETEGGVIAGAVTIPLTQLNQRLGELDPATPTVVYCAGGFRSMIASSRLEQAGFLDVSDLVGGYGAWEQARALEGHSPEGTEGTSA
jgi:hydroxyacylglutathione hydrolase